MQVIKGAEWQWLDPNKTLGEQGVTEESHLNYRKKFFVDDGFISTDDPASIHLLYIEVCRMLYHFAYFPLIVNQGT